MASVPFLLILIIVFAAFAPHPIRGIVIVLASGVGIWYSTTFFVPEEATPELPQTPGEEMGEHLISLHSVQKSRNQKIEK